MGLTGLSAATAKKEESSEHPNPPAACPPRARGTGWEIRRGMNQTPQPQRHAACWGHRSSRAAQKRLLRSGAFCWRNAAVRFLLYFCHADAKRNVIYSELSVVLGILEIFAVSQGIVGIRGVFSNKFLAMSKKGKLHASARFTAECQFRERFQENSYNTYASAVHRGQRSGRQWYVALNKRGKAKRGCSPRARPQHVSTHFLPRFRQPPPSQLAFTVARPEKKPPPPPPPPPKKMATSRHSPGPGRYRLKFRFG